MPTIGRNAHAMTQHKRVRAFMRFLRFLIYSTGLLFFCGMVAGYLGWLHPAFDSFSAFRVHLAVLTLVFGLLMIASQGVLGGFSFAAAAVVVLFTTVSSDTSVAEVSGKGRAVYRLLQINVRFDNPTPKHLLRLIGQTNPDVITAQEVTKRWRDEFATIKAAYPYQLYCAAHRKIGDVAIISRRPFVEAPSNYCGGGASIGIQSVNFGGQIIEIASVHLFWPWPHQQPQQVLEMRPVLTKLSTEQQRVLIAGDLNAPRWSQTARDIATSSRTSSINYRGSSWLPFEFPASWTSWLGLPLDNVFFSGLNILGIKSQAHVGSDHLPLLIEFTIPARDANAEPELLIG